MKNIPLALRQAKNAFGQDSPWLPLLEMVLPAPDNTVFRIVPNNEDIVFPAKVESGSATFARTGTAVNPSTGEVIATGVPRYVDGILIEEASTNLIRYSEDFSSTAWTTNTIGGTGTTPIKTANSALAPDGTLTATRIQANRGTGDTVANYSVVRQSAGVPGTRTIWIKSNTGVDQNIALCPVVGTSITVTPEWSKYTVYNVSSVYFDIGSVGTVNTTNNVDVLVWHPQYEQKTYSTSYIPTGATAVTRNAETLSLTTTGLLNGTEGAISFYCNPTKSGRIFQSTVDGNNYFLIADNNVYIVVGGIAIANLAGISSLNSLNHFIFSWGPNGKRFYRNGVLTGSSLDITNLPLASTIGPNNSYPFNGVLDEVKFFSTQPSDSEITEIYNGVNNIAGQTAYFPLDNALTKYIPGNTYSAFPVKIELPNETSKGEIPSITLQVSNVTRVLQGHLEVLNGGVGTTVKLIIINTAHLDENYAELTMNFEVLSATCNSLWVSLKCGASNPLRRRFPVDKFFANHCNHQFNSPAVRASGSGLGAECAYTGSDTVCNRNLDACIAKDNAGRFGGFPGLEPGGLQLV